jgi:hypothetical protein
MLIVHDYTDAETVHKHLHAIDTSGYNTVVCARFVDCLHSDHLVITHM